MTAPETTPTPTTDHDAGGAAAFDAARALRIERVFDAHYDSVWRTLRRLGVPDAMVDDAAQRAFVVMVRRIDGIVEGQEGRYLYGIAARVASEIRRRNPARREASNGAEILASIPDDAPGPEDVLLEHEARTALDATLGGVPDDLREVLVLVELEGQSAPEVAAMLEIPVGTVASRLRRAREAFTVSARRVRARLGVQIGGMR